MSHQTLQTYHKIDRADMETELCKRSHGESPQVKTRTGIEEEFPLNTHSCENSFVLLFFFVGLFVPSSTRKRSILDFSGVWAVNQTFQFGLNHQARQSVCCYPWVKLLKNRLNSIPGKNSSLSFFPWLIILNKTLINYIKIYFDYVWLNCIFNLVCQVSGETFI